MSTTALVRQRSTILVTVGVLAVLVVLALLARDSAPYDGVLDPRNPGRDGAQALARVLDDRGVDVTVARGQEALLSDEVDGSTSVVVTDPAGLAPSTWERLREHAQGAAALVLVGDAAVLGALLDHDVVPVRPGRRQAGCDDALVSDLTVELDGGGLADDGCFGDERGAALLHQGSTWAFASPATLANGHVRERDAAALGLRLLGQGDRLVWYVPDLADAAPTEGFSLQRLLPRWLFPGLGLLLAATLALVLWRGRRLGPLVTEPLPVVVRAVESTHSRGRLYRRTSDRAHATAILAAATRHRLGHALGLPAGVDPQTLAGEVAARTGRDTGEVLSLLLPHTAPTNAALVTLGRRLTDLENEVHP